MALTKLDVLQNYLNSLGQKDSLQVPKVEQEPIEEVDISLSANDKPKNSISGAEYLGKKFGYGVVQSVEGISDFVIGGIADLIGGEAGDEFAERLMKNNWLDYSLPDEQYNAGKAMSIFGGAAQGVGGMLPSIATAFIPGVGAYVSGGALVTSAAGQATSEKVQEKGKLTGKEWGYGAAVGTLEGGIEALSGGIGGTKAVKGLSSAITKKLGTGVGTRLAATALGEGLEEVTSYYTDPLLNYAFGYEDTVKDAYANTNPSEALQTFVVGGLAGAAMSGASTALQTARAKGYNNIVASEQASELSEATAKANKAQARGKADSVIRKKTIENTAESLSQRLQKMNDVTRERFLASHQSLSHMFNVDGTLIEASVKNVASGSATTYNTNAYSASLRGLENTLEYKPVSFNATNVSKDVMNTITKLTDGKAQVVLTDDLTQGLEGAYKDGVIYLNANSTDYQKALFVGVHEVVHTLEGTQAYNDLAKFIAESVSKNPALQGKYGYEKYRAVYDSIIGGDWTELTKDYRATTEIFADFMANEIASNPKMLNSIMARNRNILVRFLNWVRDCIAKLGMSKEERAMRNELIKLEKVFAKALEESTGGRSLENVEKEAIASEKAHQAEELNKKQAEAENVQNVKFEEEKPASGKLATARASLNVDNKKKTSYNKKRSYYSQFNTLATSWASKAEKGELFAGYNGNSYKIVIATGDDYLYKNYKTVDANNDALIEYYEEFIKENNERIQRESQEIRKLAESITLDERFYDNYSSITTRELSNGSNGRLFEKESQRNGERNIKKGSGNQRGVKSSTRASLDVNFADQAKKYYGSTYRWNETGYILQDGTRLDLSGRNEGANGGYRTVDHRDIFDINEDLDIYGTDAMNEFIAQGNIRVMPETPGINLQVEPNAEQYRLIQDFVERVGWKEGYFSVDIDNKNGDTIETLTYEGKPSGRKVVEDLKYYFKEGKAPYKSKISAFRYSVDVDKAYFKAVENRDTATMEKMVEQAARQAGYTSEKLYHGTTAFGFTEIKTRGIDIYAWSPFFASNNPNIAITYSGSAGIREIGREKIRQKEQRGNYALYANTNNFLVVDGKGAEWNQIDSEYGTKTRTIARNALKLGYDGVLIKNIVDFGIEWEDSLNDINAATDYISDVYIFFKPETQVKSADPVTYDNNGDVIPLSERFKTNKTDIRYSVDVDLAEKTAGRVQTVVHKESVKEIWDRITEELKYGARSKWIELQISLTDEQAAIVKAGKNLGLNVQGEIQRARSAKAAAQNMITYKQTDFNGNVVGESLKDIFKPIQDKGKAYAKNFNEYLLHQLNVDRMSSVERGLAEKNKPVFEEKVDKAFSIERIAELEKQFPSFKEYAEKVWKYSKNLLQYRVDAGLITQAQADQMNQLYPHYVPAYYDTMKVPKTGASVGKSKLAVRTGIKSAKGSKGESDIIDVSVSLSKQTESVVKAAAINKLVTKLYDKAVETNTFIDLDIAGKEKLADPDVNYEDSFTKDNQIAFYKDGERITLDISEYMYAGFEGLGAYKQSEISPLEMISSGFIGKFKKLVTSANPLFAVRNAIIDFCDAWFQTKYSSSTFLLRETKSLFRVFAGKNQNSKYNKLWQTYVSMGGFSSGYYDGDIGVYDNRNPIKKGIAALLDKVERLNNYIEQTPRFAEFVASVKAGNSYEQALYDSAEVTTNFSRGGSLTKKLNRTLIPFLNPAVQGWSKLYRTWVDPMDNMSEKQLKALSDTSKGRLYLSYYGQLIMKVVALGIGAGLLNDLLYSEDDEEYAKIPLNVKENNFLIKTLNNKFIKLPKGRVMSLYGQVSTRISAYARGDKDALNAWDWFNASWEIISPVDAASRTIFAPIGDVIANRTWYGTPIESRTMEQMYEAKDRYDETTSSIAIAIGQATNLSPKKIHYVLEQYSGVLGDWILPSTTEKAEQGWIAANFIVDPEYTNNISTKYYDIKDEINYAKSGGDITALMVNKYLNASDNLLSDIYKAKRDIANYNTLSADEKKLLISSLPTLSEQLNLAGKDTLTDAEKRQYTDILQALLNGTMAQVTANVENFEDITIKNGFANDFSKLIYSDMYNNFDESKKNSAYSKAMTYYYEKYKAEMLGQKVGHKYALYDVVGANKTCLYLAEISKIESDKDRNGEAIAGSRKKKVEKYLQSLSLSAQQKHILLYLAGYTPTDTGKGMIKRYLINSGYSKTEVSELWN